MRRSEIYREAARLVSDDATNRSCWAVAMAEAKGRITHTPARKAYVRKFLGTEWTSELPWGCHANGKTARDIRVLALCFMAAIAELEERHG